MFEHVNAAFILLFSLKNIAWINLGVFVGSLFAAIPGLSVILCVILFLPLTYQLDAIAGMMFLLGIYCAGSYAGSISAILINTPGTPHASATMLDGYALAQKGKPKTALKIALYASTFGGVFSAICLLFLGPLIANFSSLLGTPEYFLICLFALIVSSAIASTNFIKAIMSVSLGLFLSCVGVDTLTANERLNFGIEHLYLGFDIAICLIGLFALAEALAQAKAKFEHKNTTIFVANDKGRLTYEQKKRLIKPLWLSSIIGVIIGVIPGTGASEASWISYSQAKNMSKHKDEFGKGSIEGIAACEAANNAVTGATLIPLLTLGIPGDATVAIMLSALMLNGLNPGLTLFTTNGDIMYAIMLGLILINIFMLAQGLVLTKLFAKVLTIPKELLIPMIVVFCLAGAYSINQSYFDVIIALIFTFIAYICKSFEMPLLPILLGLILGNMTETNFRRSLLLSNGDISIFISTPYCLAIIVLIIISLFSIIKSKQSHS